MRKIRIGNDIAVQWSLVAKGTGEPFVVEGKDIRLSLKSIFAKTAINEFDVAGNTISWTFKGAEQKQVGIYSLEVSLLDEQGVMITTDVCDFVELVACSCEIGGMDATGVHTESIELVSDVDVAAGIDLSKYLTKTEAQTTYQPQEKGKGLSTNDYTTAEKNKLAGLQNYDDTEIRQELTELSEEIESNGQLIEDLQNMKIDRENDDYYPKMAVGLADNLAGVDVVDSEINFRRSGGGAISDGVARIEAIKGNSVVWNQQVQHESRTEGSCSSAWDGDVITINGVSPQGYYSIMRNKIPCVLNEKFLIIAEEVANPNNLSFSVGLLNAVQGRATLGGGNTFSAVIGNSITTIGSGFGIDKFGGEGTDLTGIRFKVRVINLTKMFQAGNEPTTFEEYEARKPIVEDEYAYNEGEVIHMDVQSIESQGVNAWDGSLFDGYVNDETGAILRPDLSGYKSTGFVRVLPNTQYYIRTDSTTGRWGAWYDKDQNHIGGIAGAGIHTSPSNAAYMRMTVVYNNSGNPDTFCINISDTSINGKYFPYIKRTEDLSIISKYFPQGMKKAGSAHDEIRYNKESGKWEYSKGRFKSVDLGTFNWIQATATDGFKYYYTSKGLSDAAYENKGNNILTPRYTPAKKGAIEFADKDMRLFSDKLLYIRDDAYTDAASFKAAMQGVILYYEAADWEWVELDEADQFKDLDYQVWNCGTEKAIAEGKSSALSADITYGFNAIGKIKELESLVAALRAKVGI